MKEKKYLLSNNNCKRFPGIGGAKPTFLVIILILLGLFFVNLKYTYISAQANKVSSSESPIVVSDPQQLLSKTNQSYSNNPLGDFSIAAFSKIQPLDASGTGWSFNAATGVLRISPGSPTKPDGTNPDNTDHWPWQDINSQVKTVEITGPIHLTHAGSYFQSMINLTSIKGLNYLDLSGATNISRMFYRCYSLKQIDLSTFNTSKSTDFQALFESCRSLTSINVSNLDVSSAQSIRSMFFDCTNLTNIVGLNKFNTSNAVDMRWMFAKDSNLGTLDLSSFNTIKASAQNVKVANMEEVFTGDSNLYKVTLGPNVRLTDKAGFPNAPGKSSGTIIPGTSNINYTTKWQEVGKTSDSDAAYTPAELMNKGIMGTTKTYTWDSRWWDVTDGVLNIYKHTIDYQFDGANHAPDWPWNSQRKDIKEAVINDKVDTSTNTTLQNMFAHMTNLTTIKGLNNLNTTNVVSMHAMFWDTGLTSLDLSRFKMDSVQRTTSMLESTPNLQQITLGPDNRFPNVPGLAENTTGTGKWREVGSGTADTPTGEMITAADIIKKYQNGSDKVRTYVWNIKWWDVTTDGTLNLYRHTIDYQFDGIYNNAPSWPWESQRKDIKKVVINEKIDTSGKATLQNMFAHMINLRTIEGLDNLDTTNVANMHAMFWDTGLTSLDLSSFKMANVQRTTSMLESTPNLQQITLGPDNKFPDNPSLADAPGNTATNHTHNWQAVGSGDVNKPAGDALSAKDLFVKYNKIGGPKETYVWDTSWWTLDNGNKLSIYGTPDVKGAKAASDWPWDSNRANITSVDIKSGVKLNDSAQYMFSGMSKLDSLDLKNLDMTTTTSTDNMLKDTPLKQLTLGVNTVFNGDPMLKKIPINTGKWQAVGTGDVNNPAGSILSAKDVIARYQKGGTPIDETYVWDQRWWTLDNGTLNLYKHTIDYQFDGVVHNAPAWPWFNQPGYTNDTVNKVVINGNIDTSGKATLQNMFAHMHSLKTIEGLKNLDTTNVADMHAMFWDTGLTSLDLSGFKMDSVQDTDAMLASTPNLQQITLGPDNRFPNVPGLAENTTGTGKWREVGSGTVDAPAGEMISASEMISNYKSGSDKARTYVWDTRWWTLNNSNKLTIYGTPDVKGAKAASDWPWDSSRADITSVDIKSGVKLNDSAQYMFSGMSKLDSLDLKNLDMTAKTSTDNMLKDTPLKQLTLGTKTVFNGDPMLKEIPINTGKWQAVDTAHGGSVAAPKGAILSASALVDKYKSAGVPDETYVWDQRWWTLDNGTLNLYKHTIDYQFDGVAHNAPTWPWLNQPGYTNDTVNKVVINGNIDTSGKATLQNMFAHMHSLKTIEGLKNLDTTNVANMHAMFWDTGLTSLDLSGFKMDSVQDTDAMLASTPNLQQITLGPDNRFPNVPGLAENTTGTGKWREVGSGTVDAPAGEMISASEMISNYKSGSDKARTYVWDTRWWTLNNSNKLTIYGTPDVKGAKAASDWPWDSNRADITSVDIKSGVKLNDSAQYMFSGMSKLDSLNLKNLDMTTTTSTDNMLKDTPLKQLTLGVNTVFNGDPMLKEIPINTGKWQAVGTGDVNNPAGSILSAKDVIARYQKGGTPIDETYVWDQRWWLFDDKTGDLSIYKHKLDLQSNGTVAPAWPWDNLRSTANPKPATEVSKVEIKGEVTASGSLQSMFAHMKNLKEITGLNNLKTTDVTNMRAMFWDTGLSTIDISGLDMRNVTDSAAMLKQNSKLWKITLGPNQQFSNISDSPILAAPGNDTPFPENGNYVSRSSDWQELKSTDADDYHPTGDKISAADLVKNYSNISKDGKSHTYVWAPSEAGYLKFTAVPGKLDYGTVINHPNFLGRWLNPQNQTQEFTVNDSRAFRASHNPWQVLAYGSALQSEQDGSTLANTEFRYKTTPLTASAPGELYSSRNNSGQSTYIWTLDKPGIQLFVKNKVDPSGKYKATITYELRDTI